MKILLDILPFAMTRLTEKLTAIGTPIAKTITFEALCHDGANCPTEYEAPQVNNVLIWHLFQLMASF